MADYMDRYTPLTIARFWSKVAVARSADDCWLWTGATKNAGYGRLKVGGASLTSSRIAWELMNGEPLGERHALHTCDNPGCCNPNHIVAGDHATNMAEARDRGRLRPAGMPGARNPRAKLTDQDVKDIRELVASGLTNVEIAKRYGVTHSMISHIRTGRSWGRTKNDQSMSVGIDAGNS